jgi:hypothetical protein
MEAYCAPAGWQVKIGLITPIRSFGLSSQFIYLEFFVVKCLIFFLIKFLVEGAFNHGIVHAFLEEVHNGGDIILAHIIKPGVILFESLRQGHRLTPVISVCVGIVFMGVFSAEYLPCFGEDAFILNFSVPTSGVILPEFTTNLKYYVDMSRRSWMTS